MTIVVPYGGPGGWCQGLRTIGLTGIGIELDAAACATRAAAGHRTIRADVAAYPLGHLAGRVEGVILSPPCQAFSTAGKGAGRGVLPELAAAIGRGDWAWSHDDDRVRHVLEVGRWAETLRPTWIACEQVPPVLPLWQAYADRWRHLYGWSCWAGILNAADFGVPQTRRRAFLIARTDGQTATPPVPTHCQGGALTLDGELAPWVTMADALGWDGRVGFPRIDDRGDSPDGYRERDWRGSDEPAFALTEKARSWVLDRRQQHDGEPVRLVDCDTEPAPTVTVTGIAGAKSQWVSRRPAPTIVTTRRSSDGIVVGRQLPAGDGVAVGGHGWDGETTSSAGDGIGVRLTIRDALILQGFDPDYPVQGTRTKQFEQVGNAVPPPLAAAVIAAVSGTSARRVAA
jgi:DNA (cytosine-5)-methyltransferase 1